MLIFGKDSGNSFYPCLKLTVNKYFQAKIRRWELKLQSQEQNRQRLPVKGLPSNADTDQRKNRHSDHKQF